MTHDEVLLKLIIETVGRELLGQIRSVLLSNKNNVFKLKDRVSRKDWEDLGVSNQ